MELFGKQQHLYFLNHDLADRVKALVAETLNGGRTAEAPLQLASRAAALADDLISRFESENRLPHPIACRAGCGFCCFNQVEVTPPEALLLGHYVARNFSQAERDALMAGVSRALDLKAGKSKRKMARLRQQFPCPLLQRGKCSVYEVRPLVCRAMHALATESCEQELLRGQLGPGEYYPHRYEYIWSISSGLQTGCWESRCQTGVLDLDSALRDFFAAASPVEQWLRGERVFRR
ncbi:MAG: YkgJ family cysteine cluster protein [Syntrophobacterales bacterium]|jgi:Fe-S-cluster containining protein|nr:YkgJ family cysteine cluster protein [Syntrophobacterales bacterium]